MVKNLVAWYVKALIIFVLAYAFSPIDLIPDFIPILGILDDLVLLPILIFFIIKLIPKDVMAYCRALAKEHEFTNQKNWFFGILVILLWTALIFWAVMFYVNRESLF